jgi:hypothetical protein
MNDLIPKTARDLEIGDFFYITYADIDGTRCNEPYACFSVEADGIIAKGLVVTPLCSRIEEFFIPHTTEIELFAD